MVIPRPSELEPHHLYFHSIYERNLEVMVIPRPSELEPHHLYFHITYTFTPYMSELRSNGNPQTFRTGASPLILSLHIWADFEVMVIPRPSELELTTYTFTLYMSGLRSNGNPQTFRTGASPLILSLHIWADFEVMVIPIPSELEPHHLYFHITYTFTPYMSELRSNGNPQTFRNWSLTTYTFTPYMSGLRSNGNPQTFRTGASPLILSLHIWADSIYERTSK